MVYASMECFKNSKFKLPRFTVNVNVYHTKLIIIDDVKTSLYGSTNNSDNGLRKNKEILKQSSNEDFNTSWNIIYMKEFEKYNGTISNFWYNYLKKYGMQ